MSEERQALYQLLETVSDERIQELVDWGLPDALKALFQGKLSPINARVLLAAFHTPPRVDASISSEEAHEIMGEDFFAFHETMRHLGVKLAPQDMEIFNRVPCSAESLLETKGDSVLVAIPRMSVAEMRGHFASQALVHNEDWRNSNPFVKDCGEPGWYLVRKTQVPHSMGGIFARQRSLLNTGEEIPSLRVLAYTMIAYRRLRGVRLFPGILLRSGDISANGRRMCIGSDVRGLIIEGFRDTETLANVGVASVKKIAA